MPLHHRRSIRLPGWDYTQPGAYFVTICTHGRECLLGDAIDGAIVLSPHGRLVEACWRALSGHFPHIALDAFVVMPNHIHAIVVISAAPPARPTSQARRPGDDGPTRPTPPGAPLPPQGAPTTDRPARRHGAIAGSLPAIVQNLKSVSAQAINRARGTPGGAVWQRNYYEHIVRNQRALEAIRRYIADNPASWEHDPDNPNRLRRRRL